MAKKKKEKVIYYDDNSTIADMSNVGGIGRRPRNKNNNSNKPRATFREKWHTYWAAVKMMLLPTCIVVAIISVIFLVMYFLVR
jgi:hypothetical protein